MITSHDLELVRALSLGGSLAAAARRLNVTASAVSQRLSALEARLGLRLADRAGGAALSLTAEGELLARGGGDVLAALAELSDELAGVRGRISGLLRVVAPLGFGRRHIAPMMAAFREKHPEVRGELLLSDDPGRLPVDGWDVIFRVGPVADSELKRVLLGHTRRVLCASPGYLAGRGAPEQPAELSSHDCIALQEDSADATLWQFTDPKGRRVSERVYPALVTNEGETARQWALDGAGILLRSAWSVGEDLAAGRLEEIMPRWRAESVPVMALTRSKVMRSARVQAFLDLAAQRIKPLLN